MKTRRGFTLIELLVVVAVIGILVGILLPVLSKVRRNARESATRAFMKSIETACSAYEFDWGFYPPDGYAPTVTAGGKTYKGSNSLYYHLCTPFRILPNVAKGEVLANKDAGAYLDVPEKHQKLAPGGQIDITDVWNQPLNYDNIRDPQTAANGFDDVGAPGEIRTDSNKVKNPGNNGRNKQGFDIWSLGEPNSNRPLGNFRCKWEE